MPLPLLDTLRENSAADRARSTPPAAQNGPPPPAALRCAPVSYTHLRAHESALCISYCVFCLK
ncbi:MAG: hypothetical protein QUU85_00505, partial [Candidatus Eisenbacteria bacterium]|nr:hypothetical protein [Candidatus Eisenbacteria bacterium]